MIRYARAARVASSSGLSGATALAPPRTGGNDPAAPSPPVSRPPPGLRAGQGPAGATLDSATDTPGSSSGASAAGYVRKRRESLPEPRPTPGYRSAWDRFARWCDSRNLQYWPARPETVADYLGFCAVRCSLASLHRIRSAISTTHRGGGFGELFKAGVVAATLEELASAKGQIRARGKNVSGSSLDAADFESIRKAALEPQWRGRGFERREVATRRGQVDVALCSLVLEAGLGGEQAAALEWRDLAVDANERPTIAIRPGSGSAGNVIVISNRARDDLRAIAPKSAEPRRWIFGLNANQIADRVRAVARVRDAGLECRVVDRAPRRRGHAATTEVRDSTVRVRATYWQAFRSWCDKNGKVHGGIVCPRVPRRSSSI